MPEIEFDEWIRRGHDVAGSFGLDTTTANGDLIGNLLAAIACWFHESTGRDMLAWMADPP